MANKVGNGKTCLLMCFLLSFVHMTKLAAQHGGPCGECGQKSIIESNQNDAITNAEELDEVDKLLQKLNKPAVKSLKSPDGDTIDCVHILHQPAFDHPKLKGHKIQMGPTFLPKGKSAVSKTKPVNQTWHQSGSCPEGTVPIRRTTKEDVMRASSLQRFAMKDIKSIPTNLPQSLYSSKSNHEYAIAQVRKDRYYGAKATINIWNSNVQQRNEFSLSQIWVMNEDDSGNVESIEAGWQIHPMLYGDVKARLFAYWTSDSYERTGCYNLQCSGFVQVSGSVVVGGALRPSVEGGAQNTITLTILKDHGNWWLRVQDTNVGYWPSSLFDRLYESATITQWGGEVMNKRSNGRHTTTEMGSGNFPRAGLGKASYFRDVYYINENNHLVNPYLSVLATKPKCYDISVNGYSSDWGTSFFYGGPGRNSNCPI